MAIASTEAAAHPSNAAEKTLADRRSRSRGQEHVTGRRLGWATRSRARLPRSPSTDLWPGARMAMGMSAMADTGRMTSNGRPQRPVGDGLAPKARAIRTPARHARPAAAATDSTVVRDRLEEASPAGQRPRVCCQRAEARHLPPAPSHHAAACTTAASATGPTAPRSHPLTGCDASERTPGYGVSVRLLSPGTRDCVEPAQLP
jgi:hypothetical protein